MQSKLLDIAEELFAESGYAATSIRKIADAAGVNPALVHYYFGTKRDLLVTVMNRVLEPMAENVAALQEADSLEAFDVARLMFNMLERHPAMPRLIVREVLLSSGEIHAYFAEHFAPRLGGALPGLLGIQQAKGRLNPDLDPGAATLMLLSLCVFPFVARSIAEPFLNVHYDEAGLENYLAQIKLVLNDGMTP
ncbi:MAG: TetR family transcriptional regulator [Xanthomonadales bacterium]|nr:TetR family transcriptional regulator [Xanthomonadales bacterium]